MRRSKTVIDGTVQVVLNGRRQVASHMISYAPHAQERMKNHFTMIAKDCKVTHFRNVILIELEKTVLIQDHIISVMGPCESFLRVKRNICLLHLVDDEKKKHLLKWIYENK